MSNKSLSKYISEAIQGGVKLIDLDEITYPDGKVVRMDDVQSKVHSCMMMIMSDFSYFTPALQALTPIFTNEINTMATDGVRLLMNPRFTIELSDIECVYVLLHECMHCILNHGFREKQGSYEHERANIAMDYEVNGILEYDGVVKKGITDKLGGYIDQKYQNVPWEKIYPDVSGGGNKPKSNGEPQSGQGTGSQGDGQQPQFSDDYIKGWNQAIADYNSGKLKI